MNSLDDLLAEIGLGNQISVVIAHRLLGEKLEIDTDGDLSNNTYKETESGVLIKGVDGLLINFAKCCHPIPGIRLWLMLVRVKDW